MFLKLCLKLMLKWDHNNISIHVKLYLDRIYYKQRGYCGRDRMVVGFTTTYPISAYHHLSCELYHAHGEVHSIQHCDNVVSELRQVCGFSGHSGFLHQ